MKVLACYSIKGGVGKTTAAINLAYEASVRGARTLLWDLDPQGAATFLCRVAPDIKGGAEGMLDHKRRLANHIKSTDHAGLDIVPADWSHRHLDIYLDERKRSTERLAELLEPINSDYDIVILDCPPGITLTSESVFGAVDALVVPTIPSTLSQRTIEQLQGFLDGLKHPPILLAFGSMVDRRRKLHNELIADLGRTVPGFLHTVIPYASVIERMGVERQPVAVFSLSHAAIAFAQLWEEITERLAIA